MADGYLSLDLLNMEARFHRLERRLYRVELREIQDPFDLTDIEFKERYHVSPALILDLIDILGPQIQRTTITGLSAEKQVLKDLQNIISSEVLYQKFFREDQKKEPKKKFFQPFLTANC